MRTIKVTIEGISPLLMHNPAGMRAPSGDLKVGKEQFSAEADALASCYLLNGNGGGFYLPNPAFRACILAAAKGRKFGKTFATTVVKGAVFAAVEKTPLIDPETGELLKDYIIDTRRAVVQRNAILRSRAKLEEWGAVVEFEYDEDFIHPEQIGELMDIGGRTIGVGDYRPEKSGPFGRFRVVSIK